MGRHNAVDKVIGAELRDGDVTLLGFVRGTAFNIDSRPERIAVSSRCPAERRCV